MSESSGIIPIQPISGKENSSKLDALIASIDDVLFEINDEYQILEIWMTKSSFFPDIPSGLLGKRIHEIFTGAFGSSLREAIRVAVFSSKVVTVELQASLPDQDDRYYRIRISPWDLRDGEYKKAIVLATDITSQKLIQLERERNDERYRITVQGINAGVWDWNIKESKEWWSPKFYELLGYSDGELEAGYESFIYVLTHPEDRVHILNGMQRHLEQKEPYKFEIRMRHKAGHYLWFETSGVAEFDAEGRPHRMIGSIIDITDRKLAELTLRENEQRLDLIFRIAPIGMSLLHPNGTWIKVNEALCAMVGYAESELLALNYTDITFFEDVAENIRLTQELIAGRLESYDYEKRYVHKDGHHIWVLMKATVIRDDAGRVLYGLVMAIDITDRKENDADREKTIELLNQQNKQLNNLAHIVSHNLRSHASNLEMLVQFYGDSKSSEEQHLYFENIKKVSESLKTTVNELSKIRTFAVEQGLNFETISFEAATQQVIHTLEAEILQNKAHIETFYDSSPFIRYIPAFLESILLNLISNAIKYKHPERPIHIVLRSDEQDGKILLTCQDNGIGLDMEKFGHEVFGFMKTFHQHPQSMGVGLYLLKNQIESLGGSISLESYPNQGSTFKIVF